PHLEEAYRTAELVFPKLPKDFFANQTQPRVPVYGSGGAFSNHGYVSPVFAPDRWAQVRR
ncbi:MAG TPA: hypothetical protein PKE45_06810, partial [Caldilineaceae bacterium]|nr:hypothetical protein [Caldilineaceae bacterium]